MSYHFYRSIPLPLLLLTFVSFSSTIRNLSQHESIFHSETLYIYSESYKKGNGPLIVSSSCLATPPDVSAVRSKRMI